MPRTVEDVDRAIAAVRTRQLQQIALRDRRERDMLNALRDVERHEKQIADRGAELELLFDERAHVAGPAHAPRT